MNSTNDSLTRAIRTARMVRLAAVAAAGCFVAGRLRGVANSPQNLLQSTQLMLWGGVLLGLAAVAAIGVFELAGGRLPRTPLHPPAGPGWSARQQRRFVLSWTVVLAIVAIALFTAAAAGVVYLLAPSLAGGRALLSDVDPATKLRWVASVGVVVGGAFYVVSLPSLLADLAEVAREGNTRVPC
jgi:magnesium-transporting ATPase (P-type)